MPDPRDKFFARADGIEAGSVHVGNPQVKAGSSLEKIIHTINTLNDYADEMRGRSQKLSMRLFGHMPVPVQEDPRTNLQSPDDSLINNLVESVNRLRFTLGELERHVEEFEKL